MVLSYIDHANKDLPNLQRNASLSLVATEELDLPSLRTWQRLVRMSRLSIGELYFQLTWAKFHEYEQKRVGCGLCRRVKSPNKHPFILAVANKCMHAASLHIEEQDAASLPRQIGSEMHRRMMLLGSRSPVDRVEADVEFVSQG